MLTDDPQADGSDPAKKPAGEGGEKKDDKPGAPDEYADFKLPDGVKLDAPVMGEFKTLAKKHGLSQEAAQELVDLQAKLQGEGGKAYTAELQNHVERMRTEWETAAKADPEIGGDKYDANVAVAKKALETFGTPELKALLRESRLGSHPEVIRFMFKAGQQISPDGFVPGRASAGAATSIEDRMYPQHQK
ncbi:hypothetical protein [Variovorax sp.]|uniref:hypothetical protein n=1 Tax=Variovorax sp. TaxID=1871043 RepID=UPI003BAD797F